MVEKITVNPAEVRGAGDIVSPKTLSDFSCYNSKLVSNIESVNGANMTVFTESYMDGATFAGTVPRFIRYTGQSSVLINPGLFNGSTAISGASVKCYVNNVLVSTVQTASNGDVNFNMPVSDSVNVYNLRLVYDGTSTVAGCFLSKKITVANVEGLTLLAETEITENGESDKLLATLYGTGIDGEPIGIPGQTITVYEEYLPGVTVSAPSILQMGDEKNIVVQLIDTEDGSHLSMEGVSVSLVEEYTPGVELEVPSIIQTGDNVNLTAQLIDTLDGSHVSQSDIPVTIYEEYTPGVGVIAPLVLQTGDDVDLIVQLIDTSDGSRLQESGIHAGLYEVYTPGMKVSANPQTMQSGDSSNITVQLVDNDDGSLIDEPGIKATVSYPSKIVNDFAGVNFIGGYTGDIFETGTKDSLNFYQNNSENNGSDRGLLGGNLENGFVASFKMKFNNTITSRDKLYFGVQSVNATTIWDMFIGMHVLNGKLGFSFYGGDVTTISMPTPYSAEDEVIVTLTMDNEGNYEGVLKGSWGTHTQTHSNYNESLWHSDDLQLVISMTTPETDNFSVTVSDFEIRGL